MVVTLQRYRLILPLSPLRGLHPILGRVFVLLGAVLRSRTPCRVISHLLSGYCLCWLFFENALYFRHSRLKWRGSLHQLHFLSIWIGFVHLLLPQDVARVLAIVAFWAYEFFWIFLFELVGGGYSSARIRASRVSLVIFCWALATVDMTGKGAGINQMGIDFLRRLLIKIFWIASWAVIALN